LNSGLQYAGRPAELLKQELAELRGLVLYLDGVHELFGVKEHAELLNFQGWQAVSVDVRNAVQSASSGTSTPVAIKF
jgi:hypothetical protein